MLSWRNSAALIIVILLQWLSFSCNKKNISTSFIGPPTPTHLKKRTVKPAKKIDWSKAKKIERYFKRKHSYRTFNGAVLFAEKGEIIYKNGFGFADLRHKKDSISTKTPFQIASVSKPLTAIGVLLLYEQGLLNLTDSVQRFIPEFPYKKVTIENLLTQKSGLPEYLYFSDEFWPDSKTTMYNDDVLCMMQTYEPQKYWPPNYRYNYVNSNFAVLASVIEKVAKQSYASFMKEFIFEPLDMQNAYVHIKDETPLPEIITWGHDNRRRRIADSHFNGVAGDKGIYASVEDLYKFDQALYNETLLCYSTLERAFTPKHRRLHKTDNYGLGWRINQQSADKKIIYHSGWWKGFRSYFIRMPYAEKTVVVLTNCTGGGSLSNRYLRSLLGE